MSITTARQDVKRIEFRKCLEGVAVPLGIILVAVFSSPVPGTIRLMGIALPVLCPFRAFSGFDCPGCGITRALVLAFHGQWKASYLMHIWGIPLAILLLALVCSRAVALIRLLSGETATSGPAVVPPILRRWTSHFVMLSLLLPWAIKTAALLYVLYF